MTDQAIKPKPPLRPTLHFALALWIAIGVTIGFSFEFQDYFVHPRFARPAIVFVHGALAAAWLLLYCIQTGLIALRARSVHRTLGLAGLALGIVLVVVSVPAALVMNRFNVDNRIAPDYTPLIVPLVALTVFAGFFAFGILNRLRPQRHRPAMFLATLGLADPGFGRWPVLIGGIGPISLAIPVWLTCLVPLVLDWRKTGRINPVYAAGLPVLVAADAIAVTLSTLHPAWWESIAQSLTQLI